jgi:methyl-accepting chemotaxis protein
VADQTAAGANRTAESSELVASLADDLQKLITRFKV